MSWRLHCKPPAPIPTRTFRVAGVVTWVLAFDKKPNVEKFTIEVNGVTHEILLQECLFAMKAKQPPRSNVKPGPKASRSSEAKPAQSVQFVPTNPGPSVDASRLDKLEDRFSRIEARQDRFEEKVDSTFDQISDSLRQLLQSVAPARPREITGETPPPKTARQS